MDPTILSALTSHIPAAVVGAVLCLLMLSAKLPAFAAQWQRLPPVARPFVPVVIALLSGIGESLIQGQQWWLALLVQTVAALPAIGYALPSPVSHLGMIVLPDTPVVQRLSQQPAIVIRDTPDELADAVLRNLNRPTEPTSPPGV